VSGEGKMRIKNKTMVASRCHRRTVTIAENNIVSAGLLTIKTQKEKLRHRSFEVMERRAAACTL